MRFAERLAAAWYRPTLTPLTALLVPAALLFAVAVAARRALYRLGVLRVKRVGVPVVVVGNVTVGGTGKTPLVRALVGALQARGWQPGIVSRGYGGSAAGPRQVVVGDDAAQVGDEALLHACGGVPVVVGRDRVGAARHLLAAHPRTDVIVADDGLQHYALGRDVEIVVIDALRGFGNGWPLPAGPLREPASRAGSATLRVRAGSTPPDAADSRGMPADAASRIEAGSDAREARAAPPRTPRPGAGPRDFAMTIAPMPWRSVRGDKAAPDWSLLPRGTVHAVAGIAHPQRFFDLLRTLGIDAVPHAFADHHRFDAADLAFPGARAVLMTEKDAVKCARIADDRMFWLPVRAEIDAALVTLVEDVLHGSQAA
jgi:tetraacyldisaccharide 4'-kinase